MNANGPELDAISNRVIGCAFTVANALGSGFLEKVYENALAVELRVAGFAAGQQLGITAGPTFWRPGRGRSDLHSSDCPGCVHVAPCKIAPAPLSPPQINLPQSYGGWP